MEELVEVLVHVLLVVDMVALAVVQVANGVVRVQRVPAEAIQVELVLTPEVLPEVAVLTMVVLTHPIQGGSEQATVW